MKILSIALRCKVKTKNHPALLCKLSPGYLFIPFNHFLKKHYGNASSQCTINRFYFYCLSLGYQGTKNT